LAEIRLPIDEDVSKGPQLAAALRRRGFDARAVQEVGRIGFSDEELLDYAAAEGRAFLTFNIKDLVRHAR
jgi:predicted nuclease of predicted toxin-antitoxin system